MDDIQRKLDYTDGIADWLLGAGSACGARGELEDAMKFTFLGAAVLYRNNRNLSSAKIESNLQSVAASLDRRVARNRVTSVQVDGQEELCLHVLNEAVPAGGHTAMAIRWIRNDRSGRIHSVALLAQQIPIPGGLKQAVSEAGGIIYTAPTEASLLDRASWLKRLADDVATYVILHTNTTDVICGVAFGTRGGPPVLLVNHSAHTFWTGASIADLVVNCRGSALERLWTTTYRGIPRCATIPIPLTDPGPLMFERPATSAGRDHAKGMIGLPTGSIAILTVGASFKYLPVPGLDFLEVYEDILRQLPEAYLLAVGFEADARWNSASSRVGSRIKVLGALPQSRLTMVHDAVDIYVEGFPFGTTTALLEAALKGIPVVLAPVQCSPPYGSDGVALDDTVERACTLGEYKNKVIRLSKDPSERAAQGQKVRDAVLRHHTGFGWRQYLEDAIRMLPRVHCIYPLTTPIRTPASDHEYWSLLVEKAGWHYEETLEDAVERALSIGLRPRMSKALLRVCREHRSVRLHRTMALSVMLVLCNSLLPLLRIARARKIFHLFSSLCRGSLLFRVRRKALRLLAGTNDKPSGYEAYRHIRE